MNIPIQLTPLLTAALETSLNNLLFRDRSIKSARLHLVNKIVRIEFSELNFPLFLVFSHRQIDVLSEWAGTANCMVKMQFPVLLQLRDRQQLLPLMRSGKLVVEGDIQVVQQLMALLDLTEWSLAEWLAPYLGDIVAQGIGRMLQQGTGLLKNSLQRQRSYLAEVLTEEWGLTSNPFESLWAKCQMLASRVEMEKNDAK